MSGERLKFEAKSETEQAILSDDDLVAYLVAARDAGQDAEVRRGAGMLVFRRHRQVRAAVGVKVEDRMDAEDIVQQVMEDTIKAAFRGVHAGEFFAMMNTIRTRRVADYFEKKNTTPKTVQPREDGANPWEDIEDERDPIEDLEIGMTLDDALSSYSERDRVIIEKKIDGFPAKQIAEDVAASGLAGAEGLTPSNVDKVFSRFREASLPEFFPEDPSVPERDLL